MSDSTSPGRWIVYSIPTVIAAAAIACAVALPRWECVSGFDNETCADRIYVKWTIAVAGIALALIGLGIILLVRRIKRTRAFPCSLRDTFLNAVIRQRHYARHHSLDPRGA